MKMILFFCGLYSLAFAIFHMGFWKLFGWKKDLTKLQFYNRGIMQILNCRLIYIFLLLAFLYLYFGEALMANAPGRVLTGGISIFWLGRTIEQFVFLRVNNRVIHLLTVIFFLGALLFAWPLLIWVRQ
ncbi:hypothetical protein HHL16_10220 [Pseudoflavitalea sp. G-6-1-2]|uniref:hypothetical protein n=1 Tax=Pseudoflavitalea sp. G-6-1-2 TaxID=2728841 RepID=UPI00146B29CA|nr:hypothetical protein [Pseudoflavitalea sp. G-6-1-2]NML21249.1 hypothetical protein [Pseudoflavitalea sp. G-6-1-2]